ncbi:MAG: site-specific integrase [Lentisphaerae bacterium]|nr:site-specific integrase [Lentisphaerota bacterium]
MKTDDTRKTRSKRGAGRLYRRDGSGKEYSADSKVGDFWLQYSVNGKRVRVRLLDEKGLPITKRTEAEAARTRILEPLLAKDKADQLRFVKARLEAAEEAEALANEEANPPLTLADAWEAYLSSPDRPDSGQETLRSYGVHWLKFKSWLREKNPAPEYLREITPQMAREYATELTRTKVSPNTYNKRMNFLKLFCKVLTELARFKVNPFEGIGHKKLRPNARRELTLAELKAILESATGELQTLFYLGTFTGLRLGDCCTLKWGEVDLDRGLISRVPNKTRSRGAKPVKIGIPPALFKKLAETPPNKRKGFVLPEHAALYTFTNEEGKSIRKSVITNAIQAHFRKLGINTHKEGTGTQVKPNPNIPGEYIEESTGKRAVVEVGFHSLRHTFVSIHAERGTARGVVQAVVGHGSPAMLQHYEHIGEEAAKQAALAMPSNIVDADFEVLPEPLPPWAVELAEELNSKNWKHIKIELLKRGEPKQKGKVQ